MECSRLEEVGRISQLRGSVPFAREVKPPPIYLFPVAVCSGRRDVAVVPFVRPA
jgi:hypothetical protein